MNSLRKPRYRGDVLLDLWPLKRADGMIFLGSDRRARRWAIVRLA
jgi:hypothetical protein